MKTHVEKNKLATTLLAPALLLLAACAKVPQTATEKIVANGRLWGHVSSVAMDSSINPNQVTAQLFEIDSSGSIQGLSLAETKLVTGGAYTFELNRSLDLSRLQYIVVATNADGSFYQESFVTGEETNLTDASSVATMAVRVASLGANAHVEEIGVPKFNALIDAANQALTLQSGIQFASHYDEVIGNLGFRSLLFGSFLTDVSQSNLAQLPPQLLGIKIHRNGVATQNLSFAPGDVMAIQINTRDPRSHAIESKFELTRNCKGGVRQSDWSSATTYSIELTSVDISNCTALEIRLKNAYSAHQEVYKLELSVRDHRTAPILESIIETIDGQPLTDRNVMVGDTVHLKVNASDSSGQPLKTVFYLVRGCRTIQVVKAWSSANEFSYTFTPSDITRCTSIVIGVKNNDGIDFDSQDYGDMKFTQSYNVGIYRTN